MKKTGLSETEITSNVIVATSTLVDDEIKFIDPYQLANLDPYDQRKLSTLEVSDKQKALQTALQYASSELLTLDNEGVENMSTLIDDALLTADKADAIPQEEVVKIIDGLVKMLLQTEDNAEKTAIIGVIERLA